jgi:3-oxoacyl-[acyl-carrier-protein] synthase-3
MGTIIEATATAIAQERSMAPGALEAVDAAARSCLDRAGRSAGELDLLINAGVYHDKILSEPAFAALIQEDIGANVNQPPGAGHGTFSFDIYNGACGVLTGIQLVDGMLASGTAKLAMVVASDMDPEPGVSRGFSFPAVGGAVLLTADASRAGFTAFRFDTFPEFADLFQGYVDWREDAGPGPDHHGRNILSVEIAESYAVRALECAESTVRELAAA